MRIRDLDNMRGSMRTRSGHRTTVSATSLPPITDNHDQTGRERAFGDHAHADVSSDSVKVQTDVAHCPNNAATGNTVQRKSGDEQCRIADQKRIN